jgi:hypothetical protein
VGGADPSQELAHLLGIHDRADHPIQFTFQRADRSIDILKLSFIAVVHHRPLRRGRPAAPNSHHAAKASLILKHQPDVTPFDHVGGEQGLQHFREFFFHSS